MCLIAFTWQPNGRTTLLLAANRDEFHARPTAAAHWWPEEGPSASIFAGRDLQAGGTWMGVTRTGRFAAVTNLRAPLSTRQADAGEPSSRGALVTDFLRSDAEPLAFLDAINPNDYQGFNLLVGTLVGGEVRRPTLAYLGTRRPAPRVLAPGIYGLSNDALDTSWPKVEVAKSFIHKHFGAELLEIPHESASLALFELLADKTTAADSELPSTGVSLERERMLSAACIVSPTYGTRASTVLSATREITGVTICMDEHTRAPTGEVVGRERANFAVTP